MSYYNQGGGYYGGGGSTGGPQQPPDPSSQQQQQPYGYAGVYGQQQQQPPQQQPQSYTAGDPYNAAPQQQQSQYNNEQPQHANIWQQTQQQPQYPQQQQQQQPQIYGGSLYGNTTPNIFAAAPSAGPQNPFFNPNMMAAAAMAATGGNSNALLDVGYAAGQSFLQNSTARMVPGLESTVRTLRPYFAVDNRYVLQKMKRVAVPFFYKSWKRTVRITCIYVSCVMKNVNQRRRQGRS
jgi:hypothetical protein